MFSPSQKNNTYLDASAYWALLALAALLPISAFVTVAVAPAMTKILVGGALVLIAAFLFGVSVLRHQMLTIPKLVLLPVAWLVPFVYLVSMLFTADGTLSVYGERLSMDSVFFMTISALALTVTALALNTQKRALGMYLAMLGSAVLLTLLQLILFFARDSVAATGAIFPSISLLGSLNDLAVFFGLIIVFTLLSLVLLPVSNVVRGVLWATLAASLFFLAVVNLTILWWIIGIFALGSFVYSAFASRTEGAKRFGKGFSFASLAIVLIAAFFIFGSDAATGSIAQKVNVGELDVRPSWQTTVGIGKQALEGQMFFGAGPGSFVYLWAEHMPAEIALTAFWQTDFAYGIGLVPTSIISAGLLGALAWIVFFGLFLWYGVKSFVVASRAGERGDITHYLRITSFIGAFYLWIIAVIQVPSPTLVLYAALLTGVFVASLSLGTEATKQLRLVFHENARVGFLVTLALTFVVLLSAGGIYGVASRYSAEIAYQRAVAELARSGDLEKSWSFLEHAVDRRPTDTYYRLLSTIDIVRMRDLLSQNRPAEEIREQFQILLARSIANATQATVLDKRDYQNWVNLGAIYQAIVPLGIEGAVESSAAAYDQALILRPSSPNIYLWKAALERARGNNAVAREYVEKAVELRNQYTDAIFLLAQIQLEEDDTASALRSVEAITLFEPSNPVVFFQLGLLRYGSGDFVGAAQALERAVALNNVYANARYFLGLSYWRLGNNAAALQQFRAVRETNPDNQEVVSIIQNLEEGKAPFADLEATDDITTLEDLPIEVQDAESATDAQAALAE